MSYSEFYTRIIRGNGKMIPNLEDILFFLKQRNIDLP